MLQDSQSQNEPKKRTALGAVLFFIESSVLFLDEVQELDLLTLLDG
jgi:hypothetical protein